MKLTRKKARIVERAVDDWEEDDLLDADKAEELRDSIEQVWIDWKRLARISIRISIVCIIISVLSLLANEFIVSLLENLIDVSASTGILLLGIIAFFFFRWGIRRRENYPDKVYSTEVIFLFGTLAIAGAIACFEIIAEQHIDNFTYLFLLAAAIYGILGFLIPSVLVWAIALCCFAGWLGAYTGYISGWGSYFFGMNYPLRFVILGAGLTGLGYWFKTAEGLEPIERTTRIMGFFYLFMALWIMSIFGNYGDMNVWSDISKAALFPWVILFGAVSIAAIYLGLRRDDEIARGFGLTFLFINLYTRFFEHFWSAFPKALFFAILAVSFWWIGAKAEKIWSIGGRTKKKE